MRKIHGENSISEELHSNFWTKAFGFAIFLGLLENYAFWTDFEPVYSYTHDLMRTLIFVLATKPSVGCQMGGNHLWFFWSKACENFWQESLFLHNVSFGLNLVHQSCSDLWSENQCIFSKPSSNSNSNNNTATIAAVRSSLCTIFFKTSSYS